jgi:hypothetical protein
MKKGILYHWKNAKKRQILTHDIDRRNNLQKKYTEIFVPDK